MFLLSVDFSRASVQNPVRQTYSFGPGTARPSGGGTVVLYGVAPQYGNPQNNNPENFSIDEFYLTSQGRDLSFGDACPSTRPLPADSIYPLSVFILGGTSNKTVYACSSVDKVVVGIADFEYVTRSPYGQPSSPSVPVAGSSLSDNPTSSPSQSPVRPPSLAPSASPVAWVREFSEI